MREGKAVKSTSNNFSVDINSSVDCSSRNIIYMLGCKRCPEQYIGESERSLRERFSEHKGYVTKATGSHFNERGHSLSVMEITILEKVFSDNPQFRKQREKMYINKFNTRYKGLNRMNGGWGLLIAILKKFLLLLVIW